MKLFHGKAAQEPEEQVYQAVTPAITVDNVYLSYRSIVPVSKRKTEDGKKKSGRVEHFEALHGISFEIAQGEIVGLIGRNGSGKSTLLRVLAGIFEADRGTVDLHGKTVSLLALGVGFQKQLSGRENIYLSGMLMGFSKQRIDSQVDEIIEFSELGTFIDKPVQTYSSGMQSKLGFAITAILKTDIILVDEVLSVGDEVNAKITNIDNEKQKISLSIRALSEPAPAPRREEENAAEAPVDEPQEDALVFSVNADGVTEGEAPAEE
jgi:ABC-type polysaccharide/polyol phosphate transport system ATPase subunit